jgi:hypothetical protein
MNVSRQWVGAGKAFLEEGGGNERVDHEFRRCLSFEVLTPYDGPWSGINKAEGEVDQRAIFNALLQGSRGRQRSAPSGWILRSR